MEFIDFLKQRESKLIQTIGEDDWKENKVYFVDEIVLIVTEWNTLYPDKLHKNENQQFTDSFYLT